MSDVSAFIGDAGAGWVRTYRGLPPGEVVARAEQAGHQVRVLRPGVAYNADFRPDRLNVFLDEDGNVVELTAG